MLWPYIILSYLSLFALGLSDNVRGPLFPEILKAFSLNDTQGSLIFAFSASASFFGSLLGARWLKKFNKVRVLDAGLIFCTVGLVGMGASPQFEVLLGFSLVFGFSMGVMGVCQNTLAAIGSTERRRNQVLAGLHSMYGLASLLAPLIVSGIWLATGSWRWVFWAIATVPLVIVLYSFFVATKVDPVMHSRDHHNRKVAFGPRLWVALMLGCYVVTEIMVSSRLALYMSRIRGLSLQESSYYVSAFFVCLLAGRLLFTFFHFKSGLKLQLAASFSLSLVAILLGIYWNPWFLVLSGLTMAPAYPLAVSYMAQVFPGALAPAISVAMATQSFLIILMHLLVGRLTDSLGIQWALMVGPVALFVALMMLLLDRKVLQYVAVGCCLLFLNPAKADMNANVDWVYRVPAAAESTPERDYVTEQTGKVSHFVDHRSVAVISSQRTWSVGDILGVQSQYPEVGVIAFLEVQSIKKANQEVVLVCRLLRSTRTNFVQVGDLAFRVDLNQVNPKYKGSTELLVKRTSETISSRYHYLVTQGVSIGETAQTLQEGEVLATWYSQMNYGLSDGLMLGTVLLGNLVGAPNLSAKWRFYSSESNIFSVALNAAKLPTEPKTNVNATFYWDSISSDSVISHTYLSLALLSFEEAEDKTAIKAFGTSSIQTGYEFIQDDWNRILVGPVYNFEKKSVGGYLGYMKIWDRFHFLVAMNSTNIAEFRPSTTNGYYFFFDAFWRF